MTQLDGPILIWPRLLDPWFAELPKRLAQLFDRVGDFDLDSAPAGATVVLVLPIDGEHSTKAVAWLEQLESDRPLNLIVVADDSYLGSDSRPQRAAICGAAVSVIRSLAVKRGTEVRANVVCLPVTVHGVSTALIGPLRLEPEIADLVEAVRFFAGADGDYLSGQILFVNGGRQLFSSHTS